jgi:hypothetical protein
MNNVISQSGIGFGDENLTSGKPGNRIKKMPVKTEN